MSIARPKNKLKTPNNSPEKISPKKKKQLEEIEFALQSVVGEGMNLNQKQFKGTKITIDTINRYLKNPQKNYQQLQDLSKYFYSASGIYQALVDHFAFLSKYYHSIIPIGNLINPTDKTNIKKYHYENALRCQMLKIKENSAKFALDLFINGETFYYKLEDKNGIIYQRLDNELCIPISVESINNNEIIRIAVNMNKLNDEIIGYYPNEIRTAYELFKKQSQNESFIDGYYMVSNKGFCFTFNKEGRGIPPLLYTLPYLLSIEAKKELQDRVDVINSTKMIHNKIPVNSKDGKPIVEPAVAKAYNEAIKLNLISRNLEDDMFSITSPFDSTVLNLDTAKSNNAKSMVKAAKSDFYDETGTSEFIFNSDKGGAEAIKRSIIEDSARAINKILFMLENYYSFELNGVKGFIKYKVSMKESTQHNEFERAKQSKEELAFGFPILEHYANLGYTPLEAINSIIVENMLGVKDWLVPVKSSHTQSNSDSDNKGGNKSVDEMRENGDTVSDTTEAKENSGKDYS